MRFLDPAFLWGLAALSVPLVLHLLLRRRVPVLSFPLMRLVERAERSQQPRRRLNRVLLLICRALLLALLALGLARLTLGGTEVGATGPVAVVVVVDDSMSMGARARSGGTLLQAGSEMADSFLAALPDGSVAARILMSDAESGEHDGFMALDDARRVLSKTEPTALHLTAGPGVRAALRILRQAPLQDRRLVLVTDLARHGLSDLALGSADAARPRLHVLAPDRAEGANLSLSGVDAATLPGGRLRVSARVALWGQREEQRAADVQVRVGPLGGDLRLAASGRVMAGQGASAERRFELEAPAAGLGVAQCSLPADVLPADDSRVAVHEVAPRPKVLVVDGDPQNISFGSETFYVEKALAPGVGLDLDAEVRPLPELSAQDLAGRSAIVLCNVPELSQQRLHALEEVVRGGTGLVVALGNRVDPVSWRGALGALLPGELGELRQSAAGLALTGPQGTIPRVAVMQWYALTPAAGARVTWTLAGGAPAVVEGTHGAGRTLLFVSTLDRDWNDLPISPHFLAFLRDAIDSVAPRPAGTALPPVIAGETADLSSLRLEAGAEVVGPDGRREDVPADGIFRRTLLPGAWRVRSEGRIVGAFAVVTDPAESDLTRMGPDELAGLVQGAVDPSGLSGRATAPTGGLALWKALLVALVILGALEGWLARAAS